MSRVVLRRWDSLQYRKFLVFCCENDTVKMTHRVVEILDIPNGAYQIMTDGITVQYFSALSDECSQQDRKNNLGKYLD